MIVMRKIKSWIGGVSCVSHGGAISILSHLEVLLCGLVTGS